MGRRASRRRLPLVVGLVGLVLLGGGLILAFSADIRCKGRPMLPGEECDRAFTQLPDQGGPDHQPDFSYTTTYEQEVRIRRGPGWLLIAVGGTLLYGSRRLARRYQREAAARERHARRREAVAQAQGWVYRAQDPSATHAWQDERLLGAVPVARYVLSGEANGRPFQLFDVAHALEEAIDALGGVRRFTVCAVPLGFEAPTLQVIVAQAHLDQLRMVSPSPAEEVDLAASDEAFHWAVTARTPAATAAAARRLLTPAVGAHVRAHQLSFVLLGAWLSVTVPLVEDAEAIVPLVEATTELAALLPDPPGAGPGWDLGATVKRFLNWLWPDGRS